MLIEPDWLNMLVDRDGNKVNGIQSWPIMILQPHTWTIGVVVILTGTQIWIIAVDEKGYDFDTYD